MRSRELLPSVFPALAAADSAQPSRSAASSCEADDERASTATASRAAATRRCSPSGSRSIAARSAQRARDPHAELKTKIHRTCIARLGNAFLNLEGSDELARRVREIVAEELNADEAPLSPSDRADLERQIADDILGYGPLEPFLQDPTVTEVMVNGADQVYVERAGRIEETETSLPRRRAPPADHRPHRLPGRAAHRRVVADGRRAPARRQPRQRDHPAARAARPVAHDPEVRARRAHARAPRRARHAHASRRPSSSRSASRGKLNILISGGTGTGKTTLLNAVSAYVPADGADRHDRGRRRAAAAAAARRLARVAAAERRGRGRDHASATSSATRSACGPTGSSSARSAAPRRSTCCRR